jgi:hypothetical protein
MESAYGHSRNRLDFRYNGLIHARVTNPPPVPGHAFDPGYNARVALRLAQNARTVKWIRASLLLADTPEERHGVYPNHSRKRATEAPEATEI